MARFNPVKNSMVAGELSPLLEGRDDLDQLFQGMRQAENMIILAQGGASRRPGSRYVAEVKDSSDAGALFEFQVSTDQPYVIEAGDLYFRFYVNQGQLVSGTPVEVVTPYLASELGDIQDAHESDVAYFTSPTHPLYKLLRTSATTFTFARVAYRDGHAPMRPENLDDTITCTYTFPGSVPTITWSEDIGLTTGNDVGRYVRATNGANEVWVLVTGVTSGSVVTGTLEGSTGTPTSVTATDDWALGVESDVEGFYACSFYQGRLGVFGAPGVLDNWWLSKSDDFENFELSDPAADDAANADKAIHKRVTSKGRVNTIMWAADADDALVIGTTGGEFRILGDADGVLTPIDATVTPATSRGSIHTPSAVVDSVILFVQRNARKLREFSFDLSKDGRVARDISILAEHLLQDAGGATEMNYQQDPWSILWLTTAVGTLIGFTFEREQDIIGAHRHVLGGNFQGGPAVVESVAVIPTPDEEEDQIWMIVKRTIGGATVRYVEYLDHHFDPTLTAKSSELEHITAGDLAFFVDSGLTLNVPVTVSGVTAADPAVITATSHGFADGNTVRLRDIQGTKVAGAGALPDVDTLADAINNRSFLVNNKTTHTFELQEIDSATDFSTATFSAYTSGGTARKEETVITGGDHLDGEVVQILADGASVPDATMTSGSITLAEPASIIHIGLANGVIGETQRFIGGSRIGSDQGDTGQIGRAVFRVHKSSRSFDVGQGPAPETIEEVDARDTSDFMDMAPPLFSGDIEVDVPGEFTLEKTVFFRQLLPLPLTITMIAPKMESNVR